MCLHKRNNYFNAAANDVSSSVEVVDVAARDTEFTGHLVDLCCHISLANTAKSAVDENSLTIPIHSLDDSQLGDF